MKNLLLSSACYAPEVGNGSASGSTPPAASADPPSPDFNILDFDPSPDPSQPPAGGQDDPKEVASPPSPQVPAGQEEEQNGDDLPPPSPAPNDRDPLVQELSRLNEVLAQQQQRNEPPPPKERGPRFQLAVPPAIAKKIIESEDPAERLSGLNEMVDGLGNYLYEQMSAEFQAQHQRLLAAIPQLFSRMSTEQSEQQKAASDFFGRFTGLKQSPQMKSLIAAEATALAKELYAKGRRDINWNQEFREELGKRVYESLGMPFPVLKGGNPPSPRTPKPAQFRTGAGQRGGEAPQAPNDVAKDIWDTFGYAPAS